MKQLLINKLFNTQNKDPYVVGYFSAANIDKNQLLKSVFNTYDIVGNKSLYFSYNEDKSSTLFNFLSLKENLRSLEKFLLGLDIITSRTAFVDYLSFNQFFKDQISGGTKYLCELYPFIHTTLKNKTTLFVEDFGTNLHPLISQAIVNMFISHKAKLLFTSNQLELMKSIPPTSVRIYKFSYEGKIVVTLPEDIKWSNVCQPSSLL